MPFSRHGEEKTVARCASPGTARRYKRNTAHLARLDGSAARRSLIYVRAEVVSLKVLLLTTCKPDDRTAMACLRSLGRAGAAVTVGSNRYLGGAYYSRYVSRRVLYPHPARGLDAFGDAVRSIFRETQNDVVLATDDYVTTALSALAQRFDLGVCVVLPPHDALTISRDKYETMRLAQRLGVATPATELVAGADDLARVKNRVRYPCVMKLRRGAAAVGMVIANNAEELANAYASRSRGSDVVFDYDEVLVQEHITGEVHDVCVLFNHGEPRAALTQRRLVMYPQTGGAGILSETTWKPELIERAFTLFRSLKWHGPAQVEFIVDHATGKASMLEINGRFWATVELAVRAGIDFPLLACRMATDGEIPETYSYRVGTALRWSLAYGPLAIMESASPLSTAWRFFGPFQGAGSDLCLRDPVPHLADLYYVAQRMWNRGSIAPTQGADRKPAIVDPSSGPISSRHLDGD